jgi:hypothetical protein
LIDHLGAAVGLGGVGRDARTGGEIIGVAEADAGAGAPLDPDLMAGQSQCVCPGGREADAVFVVLDLLRHADLHIPVLRNPASPRWLPAPAAGRGR